MDMLKETCGFSPFSFKGMKHLHLFPPPPPISAFFFIIQSAKKLFRC